MSSFCVYGMTRQLALARAKKTTSDYDSERKRCLTPAEWQERVNAQADCIFAKGKRTKVSPAYDAPQYAAEFIRLGETSGDLRGGQIYAKQETDRISKKTGRKKLAWQPYYAA